MLTHKTEIHDSKREVMRSIEATLDDRRSGVEIKAEVPHIEPNIYLTIYTEVIDATHRSGFVVDYNNHCKATSARYFSSKGPSTYRESELNSEELESLIQFYKINELNIEELFRTRVIL